jgi:predicted enzyme related to lactoylglutathione lyase
MNKVIHFEIPARDYERAKRFYSKLFGWKIEDWPQSSTKYGMATTTEKDGGGINGAIMEADSMAETTIVTIDVDSIDQYLDKIVEAGGTIVMPKQKVGEMGSMARFKDTEGNVVGLWQNG